MEIDLARARRLAVHFYKAFSDAGIRAEISGGVRRNSPTMKSVQLVVNCGLDVVRGCVLTQVEEAEGFQLIERTRDATKVATYSINGVDFVFSKATKENWGAMLLYTTGGYVFNKVIRAEAKKQGYKLNQYGLWHNTEIIGGRTEVQIFGALGLKFIKARDRDVGFSYQAEYLDVPPITTKEVASAEDQDS
jgi:DNA polymerase (family 10)